MPNQNPPPSAENPAIDPIFVSVKQAAHILGLTPWTVYRLCDDKALESQYHGKRRLVRLTSIHSYADSLPAEKPQESA